MRVRVRCGFLELVALTLTAWTVHWARYVDQSAFWQSWLQYETFRHDAQRLVPWAVQLGLLHGDEMVAAFSAELVTDGESGSRGVVMASAIAGLA